jgi:hypothetical protein
MKCDHCHEELLMRDSVWNGSFWQCKQKCIYKKYYLKNNIVEERWQYKPFGSDILIVAIRSHQFPEKFDRTTVFYGRIEHRKEIELNYLVHPSNSDRLKKILAFLD